MQSQTSSSTTRMRRPRKAAQGMDAYLQMINQAKDPQAIKAAVYAARGSEGIDMQALRQAAKERRQSLSSSR